MEYSPRLPKGYQVFEKLLWKLSEDASQKGYLGIECNSQYNKVIRLLKTIYTLVLLTFNLTPQRG